MGVNQMLKKVIMLSNDTRQKQTANAIQRKSPILISTVQLHISRPADRLGLDSIT